MERNFCHICSAKLEQKEEFVWWCPDCDNTLYANPKPCVDMAIFNTKGQLLIAKRGREPNKGKYDLPGGFVDCNETFEDAMFREMKEEIGLDENDVTAPKYVTSFTFVYPFGKEIYLNVVAAFTMRLKNEDRTILAYDDVESVEFRDTETITREELSAPHYLDVINKCIEANTRLS